MDSQQQPTTRNTRAYTSPWPSVESSMPRPVLKKRHSVHALSNSPVLPPVPDLPQPPIRLPRHPGLVSERQPRKPKIRRPSTATGSCGDVIPLEESSRKSLNDAHSIKSRTSSSGPSTHTGPLEEVTPWELYPLPTSFEAFKASSVKSHKSLSTTLVSPSPHKSTLPSTGPVEEVTPWELLPGPFQNDNRPSPASLKQQSPPLSSPRPPLSNLEPVSVQVYPRSTATGPTEDVTPWELTPVPAEGQVLQVPLHVGLSRTRSSLSLTVTELEKVTPWELYPAPTPSGSNLSGQTQMPISTTRASSSSNTTKTSVETGHRSRRSTGSKPTRSSIPATGIFNILPEATVSTGQQKGISSNGVSSTDTPKVSGSPTVTSPASVSSSKQSYHAKQPPPHDKDLKFSTADRTILEQLKMNIRAREAQFVVKGIGNTIMGGRKGPGKKHHPYSAKEVPYPRSYEREVVDLDVWETMFYFSICEGLTWHDLETPPTKVLEIGCGTGTWILHCAQNWKECHFVGLDIVPLHPDLRNVGSPDLASRITWVQHNFLDGLPFQNEEFDFVHIKRIALGVPEDKWYTFFEEIARVMKPGAAFEMVEEDLFFPGRCIDDNEEDSTETDDSSSSITYLNSMSSDHHRASASGVSTHDNASEQSFPETPTTSSTLLPHTLLRSNSSSHGPRIENGKEVIVNEEQMSCDSVPSPSSAPPVNVSITAGSTNVDAMSFPTMSQEPNSTSPPFPSTSRSLLSVPAEQSNSESGVMGTNSAGYGSSSISLLGAIGTANGGSLSRARSTSMQTSITIGSKAGASSLNLTAPSEGEPKPTTKPSPFLLKMLTQTPINPRDHTLLETIWNEMLSSRWVNISPLSLLTTYLEWHFKDVRTHPPVMYTFPPTAPRPELIDNDEDSGSDLDVDGALNFAGLGPKPIPSIKSNKSNNPDMLRSNDKGKLAEEYRWLSNQPLQLQQSLSSVTLDGARGTAFSPSQQANSISKARETPAGKRMSRLPTSTFNIDLRTLNLHLALRAKEILACSESMWEWVVDFQRMSDTSMLSLNAPNHWSSDVTRSTILEMTRDDFDRLLNNFAMDLQDHASVCHALQERFNWHVFSSRRLQDRKVFDKACKKYEKWLLAERIKSSLQSDYKPNTGTRNSFSMPIVNPSTQHTPVGITRSHSSPQTGFQNAKDDGTSHLSNLAIQPPSPTCPSFPHLTTQPTTAQRLSRSMRVFVAWKASS